MFLKFLVLATSSSINIIQKLFNRPCWVVDLKYGLISLSLQKLSSYDADVMDNAKNI